MEVHTHGHHGGKKNWKAYIWEFLMLFCAVFCGFLAEWKLEHVIENQREQEYTVSLIKDIEEDVAQTDRLLNFINNTALTLDSLIAVLTTEPFKNDSRQAYTMYKKSYGFPDFIANDRTIEQLKSSGALRLIRKKDVSDKIMAYDQTVKQIYVTQNVMNTFLLDNVLYNQFFDFIALNNPNNLSKPIPLTIKGKNLINEVYANRLLWKQFVGILIFRFKNVNDDGKKTIALIKERYKL